jgi:hypothetical protein
MGQCFETEGFFWEQERCGSELRCLDFFHLIIRKWSATNIRKRHENWEATFSLFDEVMAEAGWGKELFVMAARIGCFF